MHIGKSEHEVRPAWMQGPSTGARMTIGRRVFGLAAILAGAVDLAFHPTPEHATLSGLTAWAGSGLIVLGGAAINVSRRGARPGTMLLAVVFAVLALVVLVPEVLHQWKVWVTWENLAEPMAMSMGALIAWSLLGEGSDASRPRAGQTARIVFGLCLIVFGASDLVYLKHTAALVPAWLPPSQVFWTYSAAVAHCAAGLAILTGIKARLAAILLTALWAIFGLLVHLPTLILDPHSYANWNEHDANLLLMGAAWCLADWLGKTGRGG